MNNLEVKSVSWFTSMKGLIGIVVAQDTITNEKKAYVSAADGYNEETDIQSILSGGAKVYVEQLERIISQLKGVTL
jgi:hypothetical protein